MQSISRRMSELFYQKKWLMLRYVLQLVLRTGCNQALCWQSLIQPGAQWLSKLINYDYSIYMCWNRINCVTLMSNWFISLFNSEARIGTCVDSQFLNGLKTNHKPELALIPIKNVRLMNFNPVLATLFKIDKLNRILTGFGLKPRLGVFN